MRDVEPTPRHEFHLSTGVAPQEIPVEDLEAGGIVVVEPGEIEAESVTGRATLYVVLTRAKTVPVARAPADSVSAPWTTQRPPPR